jgi:release factor glutamine methyltransferase
MRRKLVKSLLNIFYKPIVRWYLRKEQPYSWNGIVITVLPGVFHPGLFHSTKVMLEVLERENLHDKTILELGAGSGLISIYGAKQGAIVTATDINPQAVACITANAHANHVAINILESDLFAKLHKRPFDFIIINPPYYKGNPNDAAGYAWYAGAHFEYFNGLFKNLGHYFNSHSKVMMILSEDSDIQEIMRIAAVYSYNLLEIYRKQILFEDQIIFEVRP